MIRTHESNGKTFSETRVLLLRHAETAAPDRFHGAESDIGLGAAGFAQAEAVAGRLAPFQPAAVYSSAMRRARETAEPIGRACGVVPQVIEPLHERRIGPLSGQTREAGWRTYDEARQRWTAGEIDYTHEGGESFAAIRDRVVPPFTALAARHPGETVVVVAHGMVIRVLLASILDGHGPADFGRFPIEHVGVYDLRWDGRGWRSVAAEG
jgi:broad specificity phosphatase PhoE